MTLPSKCNYQMYERPDAPTQIIHDMDAENKLNRDIVVFEDIFVNNDTVNCPVPTCELADTDVHFTMSASTPWTLKVDDSTYAGYKDKKITVKCETEYQKIEYTGLRLTQTHRCMDTGKLVPKSFPTPAPFKYDADVATKTKFAEWTDLFTNVDPDAATECLPQSCVALKKDC